MQRKKMIDIRPGEAFYHQHAWSHHGPNDSQPAVVLHRGFYERHWVVFVFMLGADGKIFIDSCTGREWETYRIIEEGTE